MIQISSNREVIKNISTYPEINISSHHICSRLHKSSDPLSLLPNFAIKACRIDSVYSIYFWFSFYCACTSFNHKLMYLYALLEMEKRRYSTIFKIKVCSLPWPSKSFIPQTLIVYLHNICKREAGSRGEQYSVSQRRCVVRIQFGKNILKWPWKWGQVT